MVLAVATLRKQLLTHLQEAERRRPGELKAPLAGQLRELRLMRMLSVVGWANDMLVQLQRLARTPCLLPHRHPGRPRVVQARNARMPMLLVLTQTSVATPRDLHHLLHRLEQAMEATWLGRGRALRHRVRRQDNRGRPNSFRLHSIRQRVEAKSGESRLGREESRERATVAKCVFTGVILRCDW